MTNIKKNYIPAKYIYRFRKWNDNPAENVFLSSVTTNTNR